MADLPPSLHCPITSEPFEDPVLTLDGHTYERHAISQWFESGHATSPITGADLPSDTLVTIILSLTTL